MPRMPTAIWTIVAANPVIARASDRFRLHYAGAERANQTDQQQDCNQPSKHASLPSSASPRLHGPNRVGQVQFIYVKFLCLRKTASAANSDAHPRNSGPGSATRRGRTRSLSVGPVTSHAAPTGYHAVRRTASAAAHPHSRVAGRRGSPGPLIEKARSPRQPAVRQSTARQKPVNSLERAGRGSRCAVRERRRGRLP